MLPIFLLAVAADVPTGALIPEQAPEEASTCTFIASLHVRKCGGTSLRRLMEDLISQGYEESEPPSYCETMSLHSTPENLAKVSSGRHWSETHCDEDIFTFNEGVAELREQLEPAGCKVITTLLLREPVNQTVSEFAYFGADQLVQEGLNVTHFAELAALLPDNMLRWLLSSETELWTPASEAERTAVEALLLDVGSTAGSGLVSADGTALTPFARDFVWGERSEAQADENPRMPAHLTTAADCDALVERLRPALDEIDLVFTMDETEDFAAFWSVLGAEGGFDTRASQLAFNTDDADSTPTSEVSQLAETTSEQLKAIGGLMSCAARVHQMAKQRQKKTMATMRAASATGSGGFDARVAGLAKRWRGATAA